MWCGFSNTNNVSLESLYDNLVSYLNLALPLLPLFSIERFSVHIWEAKIACHSLTLTVKIIKSEPGSIYSLIWRYM